MHGTGPIVVGVDFTARSRAALGAALRIGAELDRRVHAVHFIDPLVVADLREALPSADGDLGSSIERDAREAWLGFAGADLDVTGVGFTARVDEPIGGIVTAANELGASLVVLGADEPESSFLGFGTKATTCVRKAPCDVLLVRESHRGPFRRILVGTDFSPTAAKALRVAVAVAARDGADLRVLHAFHGPWNTLHYRAPTPEADPAFQRQYREALERRLDTTVREVVDAAVAAGEAPAGFASRIHRELVDDGAHRSALTQYAKEVAADLVVLGTRGRGSIRDLLLGSTAQKVLRDANTSVLAVKPD
ncbi:MAG: hypothetical protein RI967_1784 [Planctomycetota bacterium]|jgi:nucleotide-binding universal stress UspA family protein